MEKLRPYERQYQRIKTVGSALNEMLDTLGISKKLKEYEALLGWEDIVGKQISKVTVAKKVTKGVLFIQVKTSIWRNELNMRKREIIEKINSKIGFDVIKDIKFQ